MKHPSKIRVIEPFLTFLIIGAAIVYLVNALNSGNWLWFQSRAIDISPSRIIIVDHGEQTLLTPGHAHFKALADAAKTSLTELNNTDLISIGLSDETLNNYATDALVVELYFDSPVHFNTQARLGEPTQLLIPIEGPHSGNGYVFRGAQGEWWFGAVRMADPTPLYTALQEMGYTAVAFHSGSPSG